MADSEQIRSKFKVDLSEFRRNMAEVSATVKKTGTQIKTTMEKSQSNMKKAFQEAKKSSQDFKKSSTRDLKSIARIVQGILISQTFYKLIGVIKSTASEIFQMSMNFEKARISFALLLKDVEKGQRLIGVLEDFAAYTPFTVDSARAASQQLLAMGFQSKELLTVMRGITDATALLGGDEEKVGRITYALGKMKTTGRVAAKELMQLAQAGIPVAEILQEELGLAANQIRNIGSLGISGDAGIAAILRGIEKRYGGAAEYISQTLSGRLNTIGDNFKIIMKDITQGLYQRFSAFAGKLGDLLQNLKDTFRDDGLRAMLLKLIPERTLQNLERIILQLKILGWQIKEVLKSLGPLVRGIGQQLAKALLATMAALNYVVALLRSLITPILQNTKAVRFLIVAITGLTILSIASKLILIFQQALKGLTIIKVIADLVVGLGKAFKYLIAIMSSNPWIAILTVAAGALLTVALTSDRARAAIGRFSDSISNAFSLNPGNLFDLGGGGVSSAEEFSEGLSGVADNMADVAESTAEAGAAMKGMLAPFDEVINLTEDAAGINTEGITFDWGDIDAIPIPEMGDFEIPDIGFQLGESFTDQKNWWEQIKEYWSMAWKAYIVGPSKVAWMNIKLTWMRFKKYISESFKGAWERAKRWFKNIGLSLQTWWIGIGQKWRSTKLYEAIQDFKDKATEIFENFTLAGLLNIGGFVLGAKLAIDQWKEETVQKYKDWNREVDETIWGFVNSSREKFETWKVETKQKISTWTTDTKRKIATWYTDTNDKFKQWQVDGIQNIRQWSSDTQQDIVTWYDNTNQNFIDWQITTKQNFINWIAETKENFSAWRVETSEGFQEWKENVVDRFSEWRENTAQKIADFKAIDFKQWCKETLESLSNWASNVWKAIKEKFDKMIEKVKEFLSLEGAKNAIKVAATTVTQAVTSKEVGHATGGVFNREHYAKFAEGNKPEAIIPLQNNTAMRPFSNAVAEGVAQAILPMLASMNNTGRANTQRPLYVGTLIADDLGLQELNRRMQIIQTRENARKGVR